MYLWTPHPARRDREDDGVQNREQHERAKVDPIDKIHIFIAEI